MPVGILYSGVKANKQLVGNVKMTDQDVLKKKIVLIKKTQGIRKGEFTHLELMRTLGSTLLFFLQVLSLSSLSRRTSVLFLT